MSIPIQGNRRGFTSRSVFYVPGRAYVKPAADRHCVRRGLAGGSLSRDRGERSCPASGPSFPVSAGFGAERIDNDFLSQFEEFKDWRTSAQEIVQDQHPTAPAFTNQTETPDEIMRAAHRQIEASLAQELLDRIRSAPPEFFERLIVNLLLNMGFGGSVADAGRALGRSGDDGVDGVIDQDALGLDRVYIQAKRYAIGNNNCQEGGTNRAGGRFVILAVCLKGRRLQ
jgi:hypothetical protein